MRKELDEALCAKYPLIFRDRNGDMQHTAMCWGFSCGDGWYPLIDQLCKTITSKVRQTKDSIKHIEEEMAVEDKSKWEEWQHKAYNQTKLDAYKAKLAEELKSIPVAVQVKEKFGGAGALEPYITTPAELAALLNLADKEAQKHGDQFIASEMALLALTEDKSEAGRLAREQGLARHLDYDDHERRFGLVRFLAPEATPAAAAPATLTELFSGSTLSQMHNGSGLPQRGQVISWHISSPPLRCSA